MTRWVRSIVEAAKCVRDTPLHGGWEAFFVVMLPAPRAGWPGREAVGYVPQPRGRKTLPTRPHVMDLEVDRLGPARKYCYHYPTICFLFCQTYALRFDDCQSLPLHWRERTVGFPLSYVHWQAKTLIERYPVATTSRLLELPRPSPELLNEGEAPARCPHTRVPVKIIGAASPHRTMTDSKGLEPPPDVNVADPGARQLCTSPSPP